MAPSGLVWLRNFLVKKLKLLIFVNHRRSLKSEISDIKNGQVGAIFKVSAFCPFLKWQFNGVNFEGQRHSPLMFFWICSPLINLTILMVHLIEISAPSDVISSSKSPKKPCGQNLPHPLELNTFLLPLRQHFAKKHLYNMNYT